MRFSLGGCLGATLTLLVVAALVVGFVAFAIDQHIQGLTEKPIALPGPTWGPGDALRANGHLARSLAELLSGGKTTVSMSEAELGAVLEHGLPMFLHDRVRLTMLDRFLHVQLTVTGHDAAQQFAARWPWLAWYLDRRAAHVNFDAFFALTVQRGTLVAVIHDVVEPAELADAHALEVIDYLMHGVSGRLERAHVMVKSCVVDRGRITVELERQGEPAGPGSPGASGAPGSGGTVRSRYVLQTTPAAVSAAPDRAAAAAPTGRPSAQRSPAPAVPSGPGPAVVAPGGPR